jgi:predicted nucleotidyltransferase
VISAPLELAQHRDALIERTQEQLPRDERVVAAWLHGSLGRDSADDWSDIDLVVLIEDKHVTEFWADRQALFDAIAQPVYQQRPIPGNSMISGGNFQLVVFPGPVEIDWTIAPATGAVRPSDTRLLFERHPIPIIDRPAPERTESESQDRLEFFWAMAPVAIKYAARDDMLQTAGMISVLRDALRVIDDKANRPKLSRLTRHIALVEIQQLCSEAVDQKYTAIANEVDRLIVLAAE